MDTRTVQLLEFSKVLDLLAAHAASEPGAEACRSLAPGLSLDRALHLAELHRQVRRWLETKPAPLGDFPVLDGVLAFLSGGRAPLDLDGLYGLREALAVARQALTAILGEEDASRDADEDKLPWPLLSERAASVAWPAKLWSGLSRCLADDGRLKDESSPELMSARVEIRRILQQCTKKAKDFIQSKNLSHFLQDDFMTISSDRFVLPLRANFKGRFPGIVHDYSQTGETCYFEPLFLVDLNNSLQSLKQEEREAERQVMLFLSSLARDEAEALWSAYRFLVDLDVELAKAGFAAKLGAVCPELTLSGPVCIFKARHPLLAAKDQSVTPVDIDVEQPKRGLIISGGNAGGKTVSLKTLGLVALMAHAGIPAPVGEGSVLPYWNEILAFFGDEQSLEDRVSTFTAQIRYLSRAWDQVGKGALVILDEFGAGTDPSQGAALAQAVVDELIERGAFVAAATHFPALKAYALAKPEVRAASVLFDPVSGKPLYHLAYDQVGASKALDVAKEHGLPAEVLERAHKYLLLDGEDTAGVLDRLNSLAVDREREISRLKAKEQQLAEERAKLKERFERERKALVEEIGRTSREVLSKWRADRLSHKQALKELGQVRRDLEAAAREEEAAPQGGALEFADLARGMRVLCRSWSKEGVIEDLDDKRGLAKVDMGGVSMWVEPADLARSGAQAGGGSLRVDTGPAKGGSLRVDLRGHRADAALSELQRFLDRAILGNADEVEVVHGKGTGALRREVHKFLASFPAVRSYALADEEHGGDGMTLVELK